MTKKDLTTLLKTVVDLQSRYGKTHVYPSHTCNALLMTSEDIVENEVVENASELYNAASDLLAYLDPMTAQDTAQKPSPYKATNKEKID